MMKEEQTISGEDVGSVSEVLGGGDPAAEVVQPSEGTHGGRASLNVHVPDVPEGLVTLEIRPPGKRAVTVKHGPFPGGDFSMSMPGEGLEDGAEVSLFVGPEGDEQLVATLTV